MNATCIDGNHGAKMINNLMSAGSNQRLDGIVRMRDLRARLGLSASHIYQLIVDGKFPRPFPLVVGGRSKGWRESTIEQYLADRELGSRPRS